MPGPATVLAPLAPDYPWWTAADHDALTLAVSRVRPATVLEFGPGMSTATLLDSGVRWIDSFEDREAWYDRSREMLAPHAARVRLRLYRRRDPLILPYAMPRYDLAFVDGPRWVHDRRPELAYARDCAAAVIVHDFWYVEMRRMVSDLFSTGGWRAEQFTTNPGEAIALLTR